MNKLAPLVVIVTLVIGVSGFVIQEKYFSNQPVRIKETTRTTSSKPGKTLKAFKSKEELESFLRKFANTKRERKDVLLGDNEAVSSNIPAEASKTAATPSADGESVTNNQHSGVDEGGIVKLHGNHLVVLRRGRLFTVRVGGNDLRPIDSIDAYPPGANPGGTWYDEMLIHKDTVAVIGYSYARGGTEIGLFDLDARGNLRYRSTFHLRSNDYYSSRNYASRLVDGKLVFYTPQYLSINRDDPTADFPAVRRWHKNAKPEDFEKVVTETNVYRTPTETEDSLALHTVTSCDLESREFECFGTSVLGPDGRVFYVSPQSVYVWTTSWDWSDKAAKSRSVLYRMPLDGSAPQAIKVAGAPIDQFSFYEGTDEHLNVLVRSNGRGEEMWSSENTSGATALLRLDVTEFSDGRSSASSTSYKELSSPIGNTIQNRFIGDFLIYGSGGGWGRSSTTRSGLHAVRFETGEEFKLPLEHDVSRIEGLGGDAVIVGTNKNDLYFTPVSLDGNPSVRESYIRKDASQGELRSHGFFYKPVSSEDGFLGLPITEGGRPGYKHLVEGSASVLYIKNSSLNFSELGTLASENRQQKNDNCKASCVDWYGNARPLFIKNRVFALLGYEIVEGRVSGNTIREMRRANFTPSNGKFAVLD